MKIRLASSTFFLSRMPERGACEYIGVVLVHEDDLIDLVLQSPRQGV